MPDPLKNPDSFESYFTSEVHNKRVADAVVREGERLAAIGRSDLKTAMSEAIGTVFGIAAFWKQLGMKHIGSKTMRDAFLWMKKGVD